MFITKQFMLTETIEKLLDADSADRLLILLTIPGDGVMVAFDGSGDEVHLGVMPDGFRIPLPQGKEFWARDAGAAPSILDLVVTR